MPEIKIKSVATESIFVQPCIKCGGEDIIIDDCGYSSFNVAYGKCQNLKCKHQIKFNCGWDVDKKQIIEVWNRENDVDLHIAQKQTMIAKLREEIKGLNKIKKSRRV